LRRIMLAASLVAMMLVFSVVPALADDGDDHWDERLEERFFDGFFFDDDFFFGDKEDFDGVVFEDGIVQEIEQEAESGDVEQTFEVSGTGDNCNQTVGTQGVANAGNAQNVIDLVDTGDFDTFDWDNGFLFEDDDLFFEDDDLFFHDFDGDGNSDLEFEDVGSTIEVSPTQSTTSDQQVNQDASAFGW
jgi:hypothetical protein